MSLWDWVSIGAGRLSIRWGLIVGSHGSGQSQEPRSRGFGTTARSNSPPYVTTAEAGAQAKTKPFAWVPAFAGMTVWAVLGFLRQP
jgi:hypothetical protein